MSRLFRLSTRRRTRIGPHKFSDGEVESSSLSLMLNAVAADEMQPDHQWQASHRDLGFDCSAALGCRHTRQLSILPLTFPDTPRRPVFRPPMDSIVCYSAKALWRMATLLR